METSEKLKSRMSKMMNLSPSASTSTMGSNPVSRSSSGNNIIKDDPAARLKAAFEASADSDSNDGSFSTTTISIAGGSSTSSKSKKNKAQVAPKKKKSK